MIFFTNSTPKLPEHWMCIYIAYYQGLRLEIAVFTHYTACDGTCFASSSSNQFLCTLHQEVLHRGTVGRGKEAGFQLGPKLGTWAEPAASDGSPIWSNILESHWPTRCLGEATKHSATVLYPHDCQQQLIVGSVFTLNHTFSSYANRVFINLLVPKGPLQTSFFIAVRAVVSNLAFKMICTCKSFGAVILLCFQFVLSRDFFLKSCNLFILQVSWVWFFLSCFHCAVAPLDSSNVIALQNN